MMQPKRDDDFFWDGVDRGKVLAQACSDCGAIRHPPAPMCGDCQSLNWEAQALSGKGTVFSWLVSKHPTLPEAESRTVVLVDMEEGTRLVANMVQGEPVAVGDPVIVTFDTWQGQQLPFFTKGDAA